MATPVSIAIKRDAAQKRIQAAAQALAAMHGLGDVDLAPRNKVPDIQAVLTLEAVADFLEGLATAENDAKPAPVVTPKPVPPAPAPRKV